MVIAVDIVMPHPLYIMPACIYSGLFSLAAFGGKVGRGKRGHPASRQGASMAPWNPLLISYTCF